MASFRCRWRFAACEALAITGFGSGFGLGGSNFASADLSRVTQEAAFGLVV
jgi:hypothetical protein